MFMLHSNDDFAIVTDSQEDVVDVHGRFGRRFHKQKPIFFSVALGFVKFNGTFSGQVGFVARQGNDNVRGGLTLQFFYPDLGPAKGILVCYVVYYNRSLCPSAKDIFRYSNAGHFGFYNESHTCNTWEQDCDIVPGQQYPKSQI
jgi:hypothetical protein